jgi:hypothetical protein
MIAVSRRFSNPSPLHAFSNARIFASPRIGGGFSGMAGGTMFRTGDSVISPSSTAHAQNCRTPV